MLTAAGLDFDCVTPPVEEEAEKARLRAGGVSARQLAQALAAAKALAVRARPGDLVLGADQVLEQSDGSMLDKPGSRAAAAEQLRALSGKRHALHSAGAIAEDGMIVWRATETVELSVRPLGDAFLRAYLDAEYDAVRHSVGAYHVEGRGAQLFESIEGSHFSVLGLPLLPLLAYLRERGMLAS